MSVNLRMPYVLKESEGGGDNNQITNQISKVITTSGERQLDPKEKAEGEVKITAKNYLSPSTSSSDSSFIKNSTDEDTEEKDSSLEDLLVDREKNRKSRSKKEKCTKDKEQNLRVELVRSIAERHSIVIAQKKDSKFDYKDSSSTEQEGASGNTFNVYPKPLKKDESKGIAFKFSQSVALAHGLNDDKVARIRKASELPPVPTFPLIEVAEFGGTFTNAPSDTDIQKMSKILPYFVRGRIVNGFGRGSKEMGIPTANFSREVVKDIHNDLLPGVYYGWAKVDPWPVMKMVMNLGWNPYFDNTEKSLEVHIMYDFPFDFYGAHMRILILGYMRGEARFNSMEDLIKAIKRDKQIASDILDEPDCIMYSEHEFFGCDCNEPSKH